VRQSKQHVATIKMGLAKPVQAAPVEAASAPHGVEAANAAPVAPIFRNSRLQHECLS